MWTHSFNAPFIGGMFLTYYTCTNNMKDTWKAHTGTQTHWLYTYVILSVVTGYPIALCPWLTWYLKGMFMCVDMYVNIFIV